VTATFPVVLLLVLLVRGATLDGHQEGIDFYIRPDWYLLRNMGVWSAGATQAMFSSGIAYGAHIVLASYNQFWKKAHLEAGLVGVINSCTSIFGGFIVFSFMGHAAKVFNRPLDGGPGGIIADTGPGLIFISYIRGISQLPAASMWSFLFFLMVFNLGLDTLFVNVWALYVGLEEFLSVKQTLWKNVLLFVVCLVHFLLSLPLVTSGGIHLVVLLDSYSANFSLILIILAEVVSVCWVYGLQRFLRDIDLMLGKTSAILKWYFRATWLVTAPAICVVSRLLQTYKGFFNYVILLLKV